MHTDRSIARTALVLAALALGMLATTAGSASARGSACPTRALYSASSGCSFLGKRPTLARPARVGKRHAAKPVQLYCFNPYTDARVPCR